LETPLLLAVPTLLAAFTQGAAGIGLALLVTPFALVLLPTTQAVLLVLLLNVVVGVVLVAPLRRDADARLLGQLFLGGLGGLPVGLWLAGTLDSAGVRIAVSMLVVLTGAFLLRSPRPSHLHAPRAPLPLFAGGASGLLTVSLGLAGPPLALFTSWTGTPKAQARALILTLYVPLYGTAFLARGLFEGFPTELWRLAVWLGPVAAVGAVLGHLASAHIDELRFRRLLLLLVVGSGLYLLFSTVVA
jgi:uncharacterized membrane protein YfcA